MEERKFKTDPNFPTQAQQNKATSYQNIHDFVIKEKLDEEMAEFIHAKEALLNKNSFVQNKRSSPYTIQVPKFTSKSHLSVNVFPREEYLNIAFRDFILRANWTKVAVLHGEDRSASMLHLQHLLLIENVDCLTKRINPFDINKVTTSQYLN